MRRENRITIDGDLGTIYRLGAEIEKWPDLLPHYRAVDVLWRDGDRMVARMKAWRDGIPVSWICDQRRYPEIPRVTFQHIGGFTRGMQVAWEFDEHPDGTVTVRIVHHFQKGWQPKVLDDLVSERVVGAFFIHAIAGKTLAQVKLLAEADREAHRGVPLLRADDLGDLEATARP